jgi:ATP-dependent DNA helicase RecG
MTMDWSVEQLFQELLMLDEHARIEAKLASEIGKSVMQTICAFANEPGLGGGFLLLGVSSPGEEAHSNYGLEGVQNPDQLMGQLQNNCRHQFNHPIPIYAQSAQIDGKLIIGVYVPELDPSAKPCGFIGKQDKSNKRKTGVWRRGLNGDYECNEEELMPILLAKLGSSYEQTVFADAKWQDLDEVSIDRYRQLRAKVKPHAEELQVNDQEMLCALNLVRREDNIYQPNIAGLILFGKSLALRRLLPAIRVDYVRINGIEWVENAEQRFVTTLDFREPLIHLIPRLEAIILDDMPRYFGLEEGAIQRNDQPLLPQKVIREAIVNALMHRDYRVNQPVLVVRYSNRLEIRNPGYSLKPDHELGTMGSVLRNPFIAAVLYDLDFAETKGSGIAIMRRYLQQAGLTQPVFASHRNSNYFTASYLLHQLMGEEQIIWLRQFVALQLNDNEAKALILAKELGSVDNATLRSITGLDTLSASQVLGRLCKTQQLLIKQGSGPTTYYQLSNGGDLKPNGGDLKPNGGDLKPNGGDLKPNGGDLKPHSEFLSPIIVNAIAQLSSKARKKTLWPIILTLCAERPYNAEELALLFNREPRKFKTNHLNPLRSQGLIEYFYPDNMHHPAQSYQTTAAGQTWLQKSAVENFLAIRRLYRP